MSVHLQKGQSLVRKEGKPGGWQLHTEGKPWTKKKIQDLIAQIYTEVEKSEDGFIEIQRSASTVIQLGTYRIVIVEPPVANTHEITIVRPVAKLSLEEYTLSEDMRQRLLHEAKGILIAGSPGEGKTTFAQALIEEIAKQEVIIKTIESPRDLVVSSAITQYSFSHAPHDEIRDILLLSRPDYSVYDEVRNAADFHLYTDLRLTGIGLIGVMHATQAIDALQRFIGVLNMGTVAQVIDTVIFIKAGQVDEILGLEQVVTTPSGMQSEDLARPVIYVSSLLS
jgi:ATPase